MLDLHIDDFNLDVIKTLLRLFNAFPAKHSIYLDEVCGADKKDEYGVSSARHQRCLGAMLWLADEHLIRIDDVLPNEGIDQSILTLPCYRLLLRPAPSPVHNGSYVEAFRQSLKEQSSEKNKIIMNAFLDAYLALNN